MNLKAINHFVGYRYVEQEKQKVYNGYQANLTYGLYQLLHLKIYEKTNDNLDSWGTIIDKIENPEKYKEDDRSVDEIENDVLDLFKKTETNEQTEG